MPLRNGDSKLRFRSHAITERRFKVTVMATCSDTRIFLSVTTSCEIRRLVSSSPPAPPIRRHWITPPPSPQLRLLARYADLYLRLRRRLRIDVTGYLRRHPLSCDLLRDTPTRILVSVGASESTSFLRHLLSCDFLRDTPTRILVSVSASESTSLDISAAIPSVATSCEIHRLVS